MSSELRRQQLDMSRLFVAQELSAQEYVRDFLHLHYSRSRKDPRTPDDYLLDDWLSNVWFDIDEHNEFDALREPGELDDDQLREALARHLAEWDAGEYELDSGWKR